MDRSSLPVASPPIVRPVGEVDFAEATAYDLRMTVRRWSAVFLLALAPASAAAGNGSKLRTPVIWQPGACITIVDRAVDPVLHLEYTIGREDPPDGQPLPAAEVDDSRTHQFFAFTADHADFFFLPNWITDADVAAAAAKYLVNPDDVDVEEVLETNPEWSERFLRITADDDRRPITFETAALGVDWDTSAVPAGTYVVQGYTYEPAFNIYERRPGVVKLIDGGPPEDYAPAVAFESEELLIYRNSVVMLRGCVDAMDGSVLTAEWSPLQQEPQWLPFVADLEVENGDLALEFVPPAELVGAQGLLRATVRDPMGREYTTHALQAIEVLDQDDPNACSTACGSDTSDGTSSDGGTGPGDSSSGAPADQGGAGGCGCTHEPRGGWAMALLPLILALSRRRAARSVEQ